MAKMTLDVHKEGKAWGRCWFTLRAGPCWWVLAGQSSELVLPGAPSGRGELQPASGAGCWRGCPGGGWGGAERAAVTFAMKTPCFGEQGKGTEKKPGGADVCMLRQSLFLIEEAVAFGVGQ